MKTQVTAFHYSFIFDVICILLMLFSFAIFILCNAKLSNYEVSGVLKLLFLDYSHYS